MMQSHTTGGSVFLTEEESLNHHKFAIYITLKVFSSAKYNLHVLKFWKRLLLLLYLRSLMVDVPLI
jgi:hypothetical protein